MKPPKMKLVDPAKMSKRSLVRLARTLQHMFFTDENNKVDLDSLNWPAKFKTDVDEVRDHLDCHGLAKVRIGRKEMFFDEAEEYLESLER